MDRNPVQSSNIKSIWFDYQNCILEIEFHHWWVYQYLWVPIGLYESLISSNSIGSYFANNIKDIFTCKKI